MAPTISARTLAPIFVALSVACTPASSAPSTPALPHPSSVAIASSAAPPTTSAIPDAGANTKLVLFVMLRGSPNLAQAALASARKAGFEAKDDAFEFDRWHSSSLFFGETSPPPAWVPEPLATTWRTHAAFCPPLPPAPKSAQEEEASELPRGRAYRCTQELLQELMEDDLARQNPFAIVRAFVGAEHGLNGPTGRFFASVSVVRPGDPCTRTLGAGASSDVLIPQRDAATPMTEACAITIAGSFIERLLGGEEGTPGEVPAVSMRVTVPHCAAAHTHEDVAAREAKKTPRHVCSEN